MIVHDWLGNQIEVGSPVLYAISEGHFAKVVWGEVLEIIPVEPPHYCGGFRNFKLKVQPYFENVEVINPGSDYATGRNVEWTWNLNGTSTYERKLPKTAFVQNVEKVTVFPISPDVRARLDAVIDEKIRKGNERLRKMNR
jgi:hypothetical protein